MLLWVQRTDSTVKPAVRFSVDSIFRCNRCITEPPPAWKPGLNHRVHELFRQDASYIASYIGLDASVCWVSILMQNNSMPVGCLKNSLGNKFNMRHCRAFPADDRSRYIAYISWLKYPYEQPYPWNSLRVHSHNWKLSTSQYYSSQSNANTCDWSRVRSSSI